MFKKQVHVLDTLELVELEKIAYHYEAIDIQAKFHHLLHTLEDLKLNIDIHGRYTVIFMARKMSFICALYFVDGLSLMLCSG